MILATSLKKFFDIYQINYHLEFKNRYQDILRVYLLRAKQQMVLAVIPANRGIDLQKINKTLRQDFQILSLQQTNRYFKDCDPNCWPAVGRAYGLQMIVDNRIQNLKEVFFASGSQSSVVQMDTAEFMRICHRAKICDISCDKTINSDTFAKSYKSGDIQAAPIVHKIANCALANDLSFDEIAHNLSQDMSIISQLISDSKSALEHLEYSGRSSNFDQISHIAEQDNSFKFWQHAIQCAHLAVQIARVSDLQLNINLCFLSGLFHNIGLLLISTLFSPEYRLLKKWMLIYPDTSISILEQRLLGLGTAFYILRQGHAGIGARLLEYWNLPEPVCKISQEHHNLSYEGEYASYVKIIQAANQILKMHNLGDGTAGGVSKTLLEEIRISAKDLENLISDLKQQTIIVTDIFKEL